MALRIASKSIAFRATAATRLPVTATASNMASLRCFSSQQQESPGLMDKLRDKWDDRNQRAHEEKFKDQMQKMASTDKWTIGDFNSELKETLGNWRNKILGMSGTSQIKAAKETQKVMEVVIEQVGPDATYEDLNALGRNEKLKISLKSGTSMQELNMLIKQFQGMDIMQQVLRKRKLEGKPLPTDEASMKAAVQADGQKVLSKGQRKEIAKARQRKRF